MKSQIRSYASTFHQVDNNVILHIYIRCKNYNMFSIYISLRTEVESAVNIILHCFNFNGTLYYRTAPDSILRSFEMALIQVPRADNNATVIFVRKTRSRRNDLTIITSRFPCITMKDRPNDRLMYNTIISGWQN